MATICKKVCDRCGKQIHYIGWTSKLKKIGILSILMGIQADMIIHTVIMNCAGSAQRN